MRVSKMTGLTGALALLAAVATGCGGGGGASEATLAEGGWDAIVSAAAEEGEVSLYSIAPQIQNDRLEDAWAAKYPDIKLTVTRGATELPARVSAEIASRSDGADVFLYSDPAWFAENEQHLLEHDGPSAEGWSDDYWAVEAKSPVVYRSPFSVFVWNTKMFPEGFKDWDDFLEPNVKGKFAFRSALSPSLAGLLAFMEDQLGADYLKKLGAQKPKFYPSTVPLTQAIGSGEVGATVVNNISSAKEVIAAGAPVEYAVPDPSYSIDWAAGALDHTKQPNAAMVLLDFLMAAEGQGAISGDGFAASGRDLPNDLELENTEVLDSTKYTPEVLQEWERKFEGYFNHSAG